MNYRGLPVGERAADKARSGTWGRRAGIGLVFLWFAVGGVAHFVFTDVEMRIMPPGLPGPRALVLISGVFELLGAVGLLMPAMRRAAGIGLFVLTIAVTPANVYMLQHPELFGIPYWVLVARLPLQAGLLALIWWATIKPDRPAEMPGSRDQFPSHRYP